MEGGGERNQEAGVWWLASRTAAAPPLREMFVASLEVDRRRGGCNYDCRDGDKKDGSGGRADAGSSGKVC
jgi:hypothetical protein